jgi:excisionase family DNA binding protein
MDRKFTPEELRAALRQHLNEARTKRTYTPIGASRARELAERSHVLRPLAQLSVFRWPTPPDVPMSVAQAAFCLHLRPSSVRRLIAAGQLAAERDSQGHRISRQAVCDYVAQLVARAESYGLEIPEPAKQFLASGPKAPSAPRK